MKRTSLFFVALFISIALFSQEGNLKTQGFYFRLGTSIPSWQYAGATGKSDWGDNNVKRYGAVFEMGSIFMLNGIKIAKGLRIGINADYLSLTTHVFTSDDISGTYTDVAFFVGSKLGPCISYSPVKRLVFDVYGKVNPVWFSGMNSSYSYSSGYSGDDNNDTYLGFVDMKFSIGFNIRYSILMTGFEYNPGALKLQNVDNDEYLGNGWDPNDNGDKTKMPGYNITIGLSF
jgi:hypothetical protein